ncbi:MAG: TadE/TadG family type IV pilus assembly protein [Desulfobaccales bacterium]
MAQGLMLQIAAWSGAIATAVVLLGLLLVAMNTGAKHFLRRLRSRTEGAATIEFALCLIPLLLIVGGIIDFGHLWYMESMLATASQEGARYATRYSAPSGTRLTPGSLSPTVSSYVTSTYTGLLPVDADLQVIPGGAGYTSTTPGLSVSVQVTAKKYWFFIGNLVPGLPNPKTLSSTTVMSLE